MKISFLFLTSVAALVIVGAGCVRRAPTVLNAPPPTAQTTTTAAAFLKLNGGRAIVTRGEHVAAAQDDAELSDGDRVKVTKGTVSLIYPDAGETQLEKGTDVTVVSDDGAKGLFAEMLLASERAWTRVERLLGPQEQFSVSANGVVATVRGTAFGVAVIGEDVDVQVAENQVEVSQEVINAAKVAEVVTVAAGEGVKVHAETFVKRRLSDVERRSDGFRFASRKIAPERLRRPAATRQLFTTSPSTTPEIEQRKIFLRQMMLQRWESSHFVPPARKIQPRETAPTNVVTPSVQGPAIQEQASSTPTQDEIVGFVKSVRTLQSADRTFDGGLIIELQHKDRFGIRARNALPVLRVGVVDVTLGGGPDSGEIDRILFRLTRDQRAKLRGGERVWVWYNSFESEHYDFGQLDLNMLDR